VAREARAEHSALEPGVARKWCITGRNRGHHLALPPGSESQAESADRTQSSQSRRLGLARRCYRIQRAPSNGPHQETHLSSNMNLSVAISRNVFITVQPSKGLDRGACEHVDVDETGRDRDCSDNWDRAKRDMGGSGIRQSRAFEHCRRDKRCPSSEDGRLCPATHGRTSHERR
jgi:hypothetical protein